MCVFDFTTTLHEIPAGAIELRLVRQVERFDATLEERVAFEGKLDLTKAQGAETIDSTPAVMGCGDTQ